MPIAAASIAVLVRTLAVGLIVFHMVLTQWPFMESLLVQNAHLGVSVALVALSGMQGGRRWRSAHALLLAALGLAAMAYVFLEFDALINSQGYPRPIDVLVGTVMLLVVFEVTRLQWGAVLPLISGACLLYYVFGDLLPAPWGAPATPYKTVVSNLAIGLYSGLYGTFMSISANDVFLFMVFGGLLEALDGNRPFTELGKAISRRLPGGSGLSTVVSSGIMGMVTGAAVSNVAICGTYTIPWMKRDGYPAATAAAIEATASTGGQLVPPVMGSVAFIMAALLAVPYWEIAVTATIPAVLFYLAVFASVYFASRRIGIARAAEPADLAILWSHLPLFVGPLLVMTYLLWDLRSVSFAAFWAIVTLIVLRFVAVLVRPLLPSAFAAALADPRAHGVGAELRLTAAKLGAGLLRGGVQGASMAVVMGTVGVLSECITATGAAVPLGWAVEAFAGDSLALALLATAIMCLVLGAGIPTVGAYILTAAIAAPIVTGLGLDRYLAHFFILYYACLSAITPPVAAAALAASAIAEVSYFRTAVKASTLAVMLYLLPFLFVYQPALLARHFPGAGAALLLTIEVLAICVLISAAAQGFLLDRLTGLWRLLAWLAAGGFALHVAGLSAGFLLAGAAALALLVWHQRAPLSRASRAGEAPVPAGMARSRSRTQ
ncbi:MAG: TRAP transporter permease [Lautropia sp.]